MTRRSFRALPWRLRSALAAAGLTAVASVAGAPVAHALAVPNAVPGPVVLVGMSGVTWADIDQDRTPGLWTMAQEGASGSLAAHGIYASTCPVDTWLAVSSGRLAAAPRAEPAAADNVDEPLGCPAMDQPMAGASLPAWPSYLSAAQDDERDAQLGLLGATLAATSVRAIGIGPGAAIALASPDGTSAARLEAAPSDNGHLQAAVAAAVATNARLVVVDIGGPIGSIEGHSLLDARMFAVIAALPANATVIVASMGDATGVPHLQVVVARGPAPDGSSYAATLLGSRSTRQPGLLQSTDLAPTLLNLLDVPAPTGFVGAPMTPLHPDGAAADRLQRLRDLDQAAQAVQPYVAVFFIGLIGLQLVWYAIAGIELRRRVGTQATSRRLRWLRATQWAAVGFASVPAATFPANLVPWWRSSSPFAVLVALVLAGAAVITVVAMRGPWRRSVLGPLGVVGAATALVLAVVVLTGSRLMISSLMGLQPLVAGRFYGLGNVAFALFATGSLLAAMVVADSLVRRGRHAAALSAVVIVGILAVAIDGTPGLGSDFGGPIAMVPAFTLLALTVLQIRVSWRAALGMVGLTATVVAALAFADYLRPPQDRTHLGAFVAAVRDGEAGQVIGRKLSQNLGILVGSVAGLLVPLVVVVLILLVVRPRSIGLSSLAGAYDRAPSLRPGLVALLVMLALGFAFNDSGTVVPAVAAAVAVPLMVSVGARSSERELLIASAGQPAGGTAPPPRGADAG